MSDAYPLPDINRLEQLDFLDTLGRLKAKRSKFCGSARPLKSAEIRQLRAQGNFATSWESIRVSDEFSPDNIFNSRFYGSCFLGLFDGKTVDTGNSLFLQSGIYDSVIINSIVGHGCCVWNVKGLNNYYIDDQTVLYNSGAISCSTDATFGNGRTIVLGIETGGREVLSFADMTIAVAEAAASRRIPPGEYRSFIDAYTDKTRIGFGIVENGCRITNCPCIYDAFIGAGARCDNATLIENVTILCNADEPVGIESGAYVRNSCIQWGCHVSSMAIVDESVMTEHSHAERHGKVTHSILGPNTGIAEGEVTASLVGPFVGFHHQSLLIGAIWPQGKGNVAYGANVGSNHTSKAPDQEIFCGEGLFFGLGVNIKFPADYSHAPYSIVATGVTTLPQRVSFPFSLINSPSVRPDGVPPAFNELFPAWVLAENLYMVARNEGKYVKRNRAKRSIFTFEVFRPEIVDLMVAARQKLRSAPKKDFYTDSDIRGIGKNFMTLRSLNKGVDTYSLYIERYCLKELFLQCKKLVSSGTFTEANALLSAESDYPRWEHARRLIFAEGLDKRTVRENLRRLAELEEYAARAIAAAKEKDDIRGRSIIEDYDIVHTAAVEDAFVKETADKCIQLINEIETVVGQIG